MRKLLAGSNGFVGAIKGARIAARKKISVSAPATTVTFDERKLARRSLSLRRPKRERDVVSGFGSSTVISLIFQSSSMDRDAQARVDGRVEQIDDEVDDRRKGRR